MIYRALPPHLHAVAENVATYLRTQGVAKLRSEHALDDDIGYRPTLSGVTSDYHVLCVEVTDSGYSGTLDSVVLDCQRRILPVRLYVALPSTALERDLADLLKRAKSRGVGIIDVDGGGECTVLSTPVSLSLTGLRRADLRRFRPKYRQTVASAEERFLSGDPVKACSLVYDEIESITRRIAAKAGKRGWWKKGPPKMNVQKAPWQNVLEAMVSELDLQRVPGAMGRPLLNKIIGLVPDRNQAGHKLTRRADVIERDRQLRTRFEHALDTLEQLVKSSKGIGI